MDSCISYNFITINSATIGMSEKDSLVDLFSKDIEYLFWICTCYNVYEQGCVCMLTESHSSQYSGGPVCDRQAAMGFCCQVHGGDCQSTTAAE